MNYITGDCHSTFEKLSRKRFPEQREMTGKNRLFCTGDFGLLWNTMPNGEEVYWKRILNNKKFEIYFVDGNHENFDRLYSESVIIDRYGGKMRKISENIYLLMRGEVYEIDGKLYSAMGGASSHDFDCIINKKLYPNIEEYRIELQRLRQKGIKYRILGESYWYEELPSEAEMSNWLLNLNKVNYKVDYVITHCAPLSILKQLRCIRFEDNSLTRLFDSVLERLSFKRWYCGHYHQDVDVNKKFTMLYNRILEIE